MKIRPGLVDYAGHVEEWTVEEAARHLIQDLDIYGVIEGLKKNILFDEVLMDLQALINALGEE